MKKIGLLLVLVFIGFSTNANGTDTRDNMDFSSALKAHTTEKHSRSSDFGHAFAARCVFNLVKRGKTMGLPSDDVEIISNAGRPDERPALEPYMKQLRGHFASVDSGDSDNINYKELAQIWQDALAAEQWANDYFYRSIVSRLSPEGRSI